MASAVHGGGEVHGAAEGAGPGADQERAGDRVPVPAEGQRGRGQVHGRPADQGLRRAPAPGIPRDCDHEQHPALCQGQLLTPLTSHSFNSCQLAQLSQFATKFNIIFVVLKENIFYSKKGSLNYLSHDFIV